MKQIKIELGCDYSHRLAELKAKDILEAGGGVIEDLDVLDALLRLTAGDKDIEITATRADGNMFSKDLLQRLRFERGMNVLAKDDGAALPRPTTVYTIEHDYSEGGVSAIYSRKADAINRMKVAGYNTNGYGPDEMVMDDQVGQVVEVFRANANWVKHDEEPRDLKPVVMYAYKYGDKPNKYQVFGQNSSTVARKVITGMSIISQEHARLMALEGRECWNKERVGEGQTATG